jgi:hypothetical protein
MKVKDIYNIRNEIVYEEKPGTLNRYLTKSMVRTLANINEEFRAMFPGAGFDNNSFMETELPEADSDFEFKSRLYGVYKLFQRLQLNNVLKS